MLAADKLQLQSALKQQATALKEKEFNLHHSNLMTVGTQAAVLAGLDITMFIEFTPQPDSAWGDDYANRARLLKLIYYGVIVSAFCANMLVVSHTTALSVMGAGLALRGPDGSMMTATDGLFDERKAVFRVFAMGLALTVSSILLSVWLLLHWEAALLCFIISFLTCRQMWLNYIRVSNRFGYDESLTVDFRDIMEGPAAITAMPMNFKYAARAIQEKVTGGGGGGGNNNNSRSNQYRRSKSENNKSNHDRNRRSYSTVGNEGDDKFDKIVRNGLCGNRQNNDDTTDDDDYDEYHDNNNDNSNEEDHEENSNEDSDIEMQQRQPLVKNQHSGDVKRRSAGTASRRRLDANSMKIV
jgi:hypothetical protein